MSDEINADDDSAVHYYQPPDELTYCELPMTRRVMSTSYEFVNCRSCWALRESTRDFLESKSGDPRFLHFTGLPCGTSAGFWTGNLSDVNCGVCRLDRLKQEGSKMAAEVTGLAGALKASLEERAAKAHEGMCPGGRLNSEREREGS